MKSEILKVGMIGVGDFGVSQINNIARMKQVDIVGFVDTDDLQATNIAAKHHLNRYENIELLSNECDVLMIATSTISHYDIATQVIRKGKHFFIQYPMCENIEEGKKMVQLIKEAKVKCQIGFVESFNRAYKQVAKYFQNVVLIEVKHSLPINEKNIALNILSEVLPHDIFVLLYTIKSPLKNIYAHGINMLTNDCDIANIRLEFQNGSIANITLNRIAEQAIHKIDFFQNNAHIEVDFLNTKSKIIFFETIKNSTSINAYKRDEMIVGNFENNQVYDELESFFNAIINDTPTRINELDGLNVFEINQEIIKQIKQKNQYLKI